MNNDGRFSNSDIQVMLDALITAQGGGGGASASTSENVAALATPATLVTRYCGIGCTSANDPTERPSPSVMPRNCSFRSARLSVLGAPTKSMPQRGTSGVNSNAASSIGKQAADDFYARLAIQQFRRFTLDDASGIQPDDPWSVADDSLGELATLDGWLA